MKSLIFNHLLPKIYRLYLSINLKAKPLRLEPSAKCLCIAPHADDESIGMGGTIYKFADNFQVVCATNGVKGAKKFDPEEAAKVRRDEFTAAMEIANVKNIKFLDIHDKHVIEAYETFEKLDISDVDYIFIPNILDQHMDHKAVAININRLLKNKKHKQNIKICMYEVWSTLPVPNAFVDISDVIAQKRAMINAHKSQVELKAYTEKAIGLNSYRGLHFDIGYVEAFIAIDCKMLENLCKII
ncbi:MAG: PIG-L family deacetylase [Candidatus Gastranaerophilales bacterium]|nr:PIG-L family deacetylase [Candidatus Gastranaerophilales bacterium]